MIWLWLAAAWAGDLSPWTGTWSLDPTRSDDPYRLVLQSIRNPLLGGASGRGMAADGGQGDMEAERREVRDTVMQMLAQSGQLTLTPGKEDALVVTFAGHEPLEVDVGGRWVRRRGPDGMQRLRARHREQLVLERRRNTVIVTETFLAPTEPGVVPVVVRVDGSGVFGFEFRRVYRLLPEEPARQTATGS